MAVRAVVEFAVRMGGALGGLHGGDVRLGVCWLTILQANIEQAQGDGPLGDDGRRPITVHALSQVLRNSPETTRRHVNALVARGLVARGPAGVIVPLAAQASAEGRACEQAILSAFRQLLESLDRIGFDLGPLKAPDGRIDIAAGHASLLPAISGFFLRITLEAKPVYDNDIITGLVFSAMMAANVGWMADNPTLSWSFADADKPPPDDLRQPAAIVIIARMTQMPFTTVQRHISRLETLGFCAKVGRGYITTTARMTDPVMVARGAIVVDSLNKMISQLGRAGFRWRSQPAETAAVAS